MVPDARPGAVVRRRLRDYGLGLAFGGLFPLALVGQALVGSAEYNEQQSAVGLNGISLWDYVAWRPSPSTWPRTGSRSTCSSPRSSWVRLARAARLAGERATEQAGRGTDEQ